MALDDIRCTPSTLFHLPHWQPTPLAACMGCGAPCGCSDIMRRKGCGTSAPRCVHESKGRRPWRKILETRWAICSSGHSVGRAEEASKNKKSKHLHDEYKRILEKNGMSKDDAAAKAEVMASREHICIPFGSSVDAAYFARVLQDDIAAAAMSDAKGNGYVEFAKAEIENVKQCIPQFSEVMTALKEEEIAKVLDAAPVSEDVYNSLKTIYLRPDLPKTQTKEPESHGIAENGHDGPTDEASEHVHDDRVNDAYHHTEGIRDKVLAAREQCRDFNDFKGLLRQGKCRCHGKQERRVDVLRSSTRRKWRPPPTW